MKDLFSEKNKKAILIALILWLILAIVFVLPIAVAGQNASKATGSLNPVYFSNDLIYTELLSPASRITAFSKDYIGVTGNVLKYYSIIFALFFVFKLLKGKKGGAYHDIEHGSSDWSTNGEQYKVLSKNAGIILAEKNYLPVDKPGNVNVLIVGRIWCW